MFEIGQHCHGFRLERLEHVDEIESEALIWRHETTGAELVTLTNDDDNKVFMITFRTPVDNDTGVPHILEHSVLNGSRKFPVKEPFLELIKSSLNTFLNAMTYPDKTVYPVASRNHQDFANLMDVYLDAVFHPLLSRQTFMQEGWHLQLDAPDAEPEYSGVVYNEMLGAYSDPENILGTELDRAMFPDSPYGSDSGGDPAHITDLTYEQFVDFHRRYYHPVNSRIFLYGDIDVEERLAHLARYLDDFGPATVDSAIAPQPRLSAPVTHRRPYPIGPDEDAARQTFVLRSFLLDAPTDPEYLLGMSILAHILCGTEASPLRRALVDSRLGEDCLSYGLEQDILDTYFAIGLKGTDEEHAAAIGEIIDTTLARLAAEGIDPRMVEASMNTIEFGLREANFGGYPKGLVYALAMQSSWLYGADPLMHLRYEPTLAAIKAKVAGGRYFEGLIQRWLVGNPHQATVVLYPDAELEAQRLEAVAAKLAEVKAALSADEVEAVVRDCQELEEAQLRPDTPEALATLPRLPLSCVSRQSEEFHFELVEDAPCTLSFSEQPTQGIVYLRLAFDAAGVPAELLPYLSFFARLLTQTGSDRRDHVELTQEIGIQTGGIRAGYHATGILGDTERVNSYVQLTAKALDSKLDATFGLLAEILGGANLRHQRRIDELLHMTCSRLHHSIVPSGHSYVQQRLAAYSTPLGAYGELTGGIRQFEFIEILTESFAGAPEPVLDVFEQLRRLVLTTGNLHLHVTGSREHLAAVRERLGTLTGVLPAEATAPLDYRLPLIAPNEGFQVPSKIQYVGKGINLYSLGYTFDGRMEVLRKLLGRDYLWNKVRVQGNAYGCFGSFDLLSGLLSCISYRDPNLGDTLDAYDAFADYLANLQLPPDEFEKIVIGTMGSVDAPRTSEQKGGVAFTRHRSRITQADVQRWREEILDCRLDDLRPLADWFRRFAAEGQVCVIGGTDKVKAAADRFATVRPVFTD